MATTMSRKSRTPKRCRRIIRPGARRPQAPSSAHPFALVCWCRRASRRTVFGGLIVTGVGKGWGIDPKANSGSRAARARAWIWVATRRRDRMAFVFGQQRGAQAAGEGVFSLDKASYWCRGQAVTVGINRTSGAILTQDIVVTLVLSGGTPGLDYPNGTITQLATFKAGTNPTFQSVQFQTNNNRPLRRHGNLGLDPERERRRRAGRASCGSSDDPGTRQPARDCGEPSQRWAGNARDDHRRQLRGGGPHVRQCSGPGRFDSRRTGRGPGAALRVVRRLVRHREPGDSRLPHRSNGARAHAHPNDTAHTWALPGHVRRTRDDRGPVDRCCSIQQHQPDRPGGSVHVHCCSDHH